MNSSTTPAAATEVRAEINHGYFLKFLAIGFVCLAMVGYFLYDGSIGYPKILEASKEYHGDEKYLESPKLWQEYATTQGWSTEVPPPPEEMESKITGQFIFAAITFVIAIPFFLKYLLALGSHIIATPSQIRPSWKSQPIAIDAISKIDKTKWAEKGIAKLTYDNKKFALDDFKFQREPMAQIIRWVEEKLTDDQIVGGVREKDATEEAEAEASGKQDTADPSASSAS